MATLAVTTQACIAEQFQTSYDVEYEINENGETQVRQDITLLNLRDDVVATNYSLSIKHIAISDIEAEDGKGKMNVSEKVDQDTKIITLDFNENVIGKGRNNTFEFDYKTNDIAKKIGNIWNINIPQISNLQAVKKYDVSLKIPKTFGPNIYISPKPCKKDTNDNFYIYTFDREHLENEGISGTFGNYQVLNYKLIYELKNNSPVSVIKEVALPSDIKGYQQVHHENLEPQPIDIYEDVDGNLMAKYRLKVNEQLNVTLVGNARVTGRQINPEEGGSFENIPKDIKNSYTEENTFWETSSVEIQTLKRKLFDEDLNITQNAKKIYNFIVDNFDYDFEALNKDYVKRKGAKQTLIDKGIGTCMEFTDLFVALARASGIPARELNGVAIGRGDLVELPLSLNLGVKNQLHAWAEFYDPNFGWVPVDPTWGNTSGLDFFTKIGTDHLVFVRKGINSEYPQPAGSYNIPNTNKKLVFVDFAQESEGVDFSEHLVFYKRFLPNQYYVTNKGGTYVYNFQGQTLLPYQTKKVTLGEVEQDNIVLTKDKPKTKHLSLVGISASFVLAFGLCSLAYYFIVVKKIKKTP